MKKILLLFFFMFTLLAIPYWLNPTSADEIEDLQKQINELNKARELSLNATKPLEGQLEGLERQLAQIQATINNLSANIKNKQPWKISESLPIEIAETISFIGTPA